MNIDYDDSERRIYDLKFCDKNNMRRKNMREFVDEMSSLKVKKCKKEFKFEYLMMLMRKGNLMWKNDVDERRNLTRKWYWWEGKFDKKEMISRGNLMRRGKEEREICEILQNLHA